MELYAPPGILLSVTDVLALYQWTGWSPLLFVAGMMFALGLLFVSISLGRGMGALRAVFIPFTLLAGWFMGWEITHRDYLVIEEDAIHSRSGFGEYRIEGRDILRADHLETSRNGHSLVLTVRGSLETHSILPGCDSMPDFQEAFARLCEAHHVQGNWRSYIPH